VAQPKLFEYHRKRDFGLTPEPSGKAVESGKRLVFVVQKHHARRLHYDFRLELDGVLLSWAIPKGPSLDPADKRLAVPTEDHPIEYGSFEGRIPDKQYGAGEVIIWDRGSWEPVGDPHEGHRKGKLKFRLHGTKLHGGWNLIRTRPGANAKEQWLLIKERDDEARPANELDVMEAWPDSVKEIEKRKSVKRTKSSARASDADARQAPTPSPRSPYGDKLRPRPNLQASELPKAARKSPLPAKLQPQLATLVASAPATGDWSYEIKFDGYRILARIDRGKVHLFTRNGLDWTARMQPLARAVEALGWTGAWLDGEIVVLNRQGVPDFQALQNAFDASRANGIRYFVFDLPFYAGHDLTPVPQGERRALLRTLLDGHESPLLRFSEDFEGDAEQVRESACRMGLEGVIGKRVDAPYFCGRSRSWIKLKCKERQEFVIGGYTNPGGSRTAFGSLLLGVHEHGALRYAGKVGTGFDDESLRALLKTMQPLKQARSPFAGQLPAPERRNAHWLTPKLVAEIEFAQWTTDGRVRQPVFRGLRDDKPAGQITREKKVDVDAEGATAKASKRSTARARAASVEPAAATSTVRAKSGSARDKAGATAKARTSVKAGTTTRAAQPAKSEAQVYGVRVSHPDRVIDRGTGVTKLDLVKYYDFIAERMLPHLYDRPMGLVRAPEGVHGQRFFQKHLEHLVIQEARLLPVGLDPGHDALIVLETHKSLVSAAQMGVVELHGWNCQAKKFEQPDRFVLDLDPDESLPWAQVIEAAELTKALLDELKIKSFVKTTGGKGLHVVVPLKPQFGWQEVKDFSEALAVHLAGTLPRRFSARMGKQNRVGRVFVDYLRNARGASSVAAYSARLRPRLPLSIPLAWEELVETKGGDQWTIANIGERLESLEGDPWEDYEKSRQSIGDAIRAFTG
jgi:bifunctional non-homologous end joining protein LigD